VRNKENLEKLAKEIEKARRRPDAKRAQAEVMARALKITRENENSNDSLH